MQVAIGPASVGTVVITHLFTLNSGISAGLRHWCTFCTWTKYTEYRWCISLVI